MQRMVFPPRISRSVLENRPSAYIHDGHHVHAYYTNSDELNYVILTRMKEPNHKTQWNVYNGFMEDNGQVVRVTDGLEFRSNESAAFREYYRRVRESIHE